jgi:ribulose-phosphate 3-epimerase
MNESIEIIPAIIPKNFKDLETKLETLKGVAETIHIDICDGLFTQESSWPLGKPDLNYESIINEERGMPFWEDFDFEFHLMVKDPFALIPDIIKLGASRIIIHAETIDLDNDRLLLDQLRTEGLVQVGIAFKLNTGVETVTDLLPYADFIMFVSIEHLGFQGQKFDDRVLDKVKWLKGELPTMIIALDGGVTPDTAGLGFDVGATRFVVGSYILSSVSPIEAIREVREAI